MENNEDKILTKEQLKLKAQEMKLEEKQRKMEEKRAIREEKERRRNSLGRKIKNFFITLIFVIIILIACFFLLKNYLAKKEKELTDEKYEQTYQMALVSINEKNYKKAIELLEEIDEEHTRYNDAQNKINDTVQLYLNEYLSNADLYLKSGKYEKALKELDKIDEEYQNTKIIIDKKTDIQLELIKEEIENIYSKKGTISVIEYLVNYDNNDDEKIEELIEDSLNKYKNDFILETRELLIKDPLKAQINITAIVKILPKDKAIIELYKDAEEKIKNTDNQEKEEDNSLNEDSQN